MPASTGGLPALLQPHFRDEPAALARLERIVWPHGPVCPHCGAQDRIGAVTGKGARPALRCCGHCRRQFRVTVGTVFEGSHVPLYKWLQACLLVSAGKGRVNAHQLHLHLEVAYKTALSMLQRLERIAEVAAMIGVANPLAAADKGGSWGHREDPAAAWGSQFRDFARLARRLGCDRDEAEFDRLLACLVLPATAAIGHERAAPRRRRLRQRRLQRRWASTRSTIAGAEPR
jgi:transposase-like protein